MAITVPFDLGYEFAVNAPFADVFSVLADIPTSASHFPGLDRLVDLGDASYRWEMARVGTASAHMQAVYASRYVADKKKGSVVWTPLAGQGNALVGGSWAVSNKKTFTHLVLHLEGELHLPLPALMKALVAPVVVSEFEKLVEQYIANLIERFGGEHA